MTNTELQKLLKEHPDDIEVRVWIGLGTFSCAEVAEIERLEIYVESELRDLLCIEGVDA